MDVIKEREKRTVDDKGERGEKNMDDKGGSERNITPLSRLWNREGLCGLLQDGNRRGEDMNSLSHDSYRRQEA